MIIIAKFACDYLFIIKILSPLPKIIIRTAFTAYTADAATVIVSCD